MNAKDLRKLLEETDNKLDIFSNTETLNQYDLTFKDLCDLIKDFLSDEEKLKLFDYPHFQKFTPTVKKEIIGSISDENIRLKILYDDNIMQSFDSNVIHEMIIQSSDAVKLAILNDKKYIKKHEITDIEVREIEFSLSDETKIKILQEGHLKSCDIILIARTMNTDALVIFLRDNKDILKEKKVLPYEITKLLDSNKQKDIVAEIENMNLTLEEKRQIFATLQQSTKEGMDELSFPEEYRTAINIPINVMDTEISLDLERNPEDYRGLDNLILVTPENFTEDERQKFMRICEVCPEIIVVNEIYDNVLLTSRSNEYKEAEEWISSIIDNINPEYSKAQKLAVIDNAIGKKISYSPDYGTNVHNWEDSRALWRIISSGYGVCNGIAKTEQYILNRVGIESELVSSGTHAFLKVKDIELPLANGETVKGDTILDPTWNLTAHRFGARPDNFCINYEEARQHDIDSKGKDHECHKNDEELKDTISLDDKSLRKLFTSVGLTDKNGEFPIKHILEESEALDEKYANNPEQNINAQFSLIKKNCPEFAMCQNGTMSILSYILLSNENLELNRCVINRGYEKTDGKKRPILFVYINSDQLGRKFYFVDKSKSEFVELPEEEFVNKFECYDEDLKKYNGHKPWEYNEQEETKNLANSSGELNVEEEETK